ncbi:hypothetical protein CBR_g41260 [Chara braunii]|uniref:O-fucosyltransferase family protein n=1 Tax=Chara braunii TaxID=69332 RepID=A0A388LVB3_CHABU|nr:hypothetical protein CBR_g41260 [Chara braunii]|eukprot:GBG86267.1 hypothetical protein CBR_g41260 [Chara braunii]
MARSRTPYDLWSSQPDHNLERWFEGCSDPVENPPELPANPTGYLIVQPDGGLNQQRIGIVTSVAIAWFLQATLVVPRLLFSPVWKDDSKFEDLFDLDHFNKSLKNLVRIVKEVPREVQKTLRTANVTFIAPKHCSLEWYSAHILPVLKKYGVAVITEYMHPLGFGMPFHVEQIRCRANYYALRYNQKLEGIAEQAVQQLRKDGEKFVAVHVRFQKDMLADSCCDFGGGPAEREFFKKYRDVNLAIGQYANKYKSKPPPEILRVRGSCPLTPEELGLLLAGMGFSKDTRLYLAGGEVYGGESRLAPLRRLFPKMVRVEDVVPRNMLSKLHSHSSRLAVIDTYVCTYSNVFLTGFSGSNLPAIVLGLRMMYRLGPSILPSKKIAPLLMAAKEGQIRWKEFAAQVKAIQTPKRISNSWNVSTFREPAPACVCYRRGLAHISS